MVVSITVGIPSYVVLKQLGCATFPVAVGLGAIGGLTVPWLYLWSWGTPNISDAMDAAPMFCVAGAYSAAAFWIGAEGPGVLGIHAATDQRGSLSPASTVMTSTRAGWIVAALLSVVLPGAGQAYSGRLSSGVLWLVAVGAGYLLLLVPGLILHLCCVADALRRA